MHIPDEEELLDIEHQQQQQQASTGMVREPYSLSHQQHSNPYDGSKSVSTIGGSDDDEASSEEYLLHSQQQQDDDDNVQSPTMTGFDLQIQELE